MFHFQRQGAAWDLQADQPTDHTAVEEDLFIGLTENRRQDE